MFHGISTLIGYLMPNSVHTNILDMYDLEMNSLYVTIFKQAKAQLFARS